MTFSGWWSAGGVLFFSKAPANCAGHKKTAMVNPWLFLNFKLFPSRD